jgi:hypothetical protein
MSRVVALAGRRIDAPGAPTRFPLASVPLVRERLEELFIAEGASTLVCSAACGADLLALEVAGALGLRRRAVLPFSRERFRETSVTDRPGDWGPLYDEVLDAVEAAGDLVVLESQEDDEAYAAASLAILDEAMELSRGDQADENAAPSQPPGLLALIVWEGKSRGSGDLTEAFLVAARARSLRVEQILTS